jgi:hypothetical protein
VMLSLLIFRHKLLYAYISAAKRVIHCQTVFGPHRINYTNSLCCFLGGKPYHNASEILKERSTRFIVRDVNAEVEEIRKHSRWG